MHSCWNCGNNIRPVATTNETGASTNKSMEASGTNVLQRQKQEATTTSGEMDKNSNRPRVASILQLSTEHSNGQAT
jgi:hypothetical protein